MFLMNLIFGGSEMGVVRFLGDFFNFLFPVALVKCLYVRLGLAT